MENIKKGCQACRHNDICKIYDVLALIHNRNDGVIRGLVLIQLAEQYCTKWEE